MKRRELPGGLKMNDGIAVMIWLFMCLIASWTAKPDNEKEIKERIKDNLHEIDLDLILLGVGIKKANLLTNQIRKHRKVGLPCRNY